MTPRVCLRCDWSGETREKECPSCGATLFSPPGSERAAGRAEERRKRIRAFGRGKEPPPQGPGPAEPDKSEQAHAERPGIRGVAVVVILALAVAAVIFVQANTPDPNAGPVAGLQGVLIYTDLDLVSGRARLWAWDLETGVVHEGPEVDQPLELVDAARAGSGWIGLIDEEADEMHASYLDSFDGSASPIPVAGGDLVAWEPLGEHVAAVIDDEGRCTLTTVSVRLGTEVTNDPLGCDAAEALARSSAQTFLGIVYADAPGIMATSGASIDTQVDDASLVGVSVSGRILALPSECSPVQVRQGICGALSLVNEIPTSGHPSEPRTRLVPYGEEDAALELERLAGWSRFGDRAYVVGVYRGVFGLYAIPVPPPSRVVEGPIVPERLIPTLTTDIAVTETANGELLVTRAGTLILIRGSAPLEYLEPPSGAPPPDGPILWMSTLPGVSS